MRDAQGDLAGQLTLFSNNIVVADSSLAGQLAADPNFAGRDEALLDNDGPVNPAGYIQAGRVGLLTGGTLFVQHTGTPTRFCGITVGSGGLFVTGARDRKSTRLNSSHYLPPRMPSSPLP